MDELLLAERVLEADPDLPDFLLGRLASLLASQIAAASPAERSEFSLAAIATFLDCVALGLSDQACDLIEKVSADLGAVGRLVA